MTVAVLDPQAAGADAAMPFIALALDSAYMQSRLRSITAPAGEEVALCAIRVIRWKPGRRCLIEYDVVTNGNGSERRRTLIGKVRAKSFDDSTYALAKQLGECGLEPNSIDGVSVPAVQGAVPECHMWLQDKVSGTPGWEAINSPRGVHAARRIGAAIAKLHRVLPPLSKRHSIADEIAVLDRALDRVRALHPEWDRRLRAVQQACESLADKVTPTPASGIHRDFYHDQVIVEGDRIWLLDLDLAAQGRPALDAGNFIAHLSEQSLRLLGTPHALALEEEAFVSEFCGAAGDTDLETIETCKTLSLVRHVYLSTTFPARRQFTQTLLRLCEDRLRL